MRRGPIARALVDEAGPLLALFAVALTLHARELAGGRLYLRDVHQLLVPVRAFLAEGLRHGELRTWWPFDGGGSPLVAQPIFGAFHPFELAFVLLPFWKAFALTNFLATLFAAWGAYALARVVGASKPGALVAGGAFVSSGLLVSMTEFAFQKTAAMALPWYALLLVIACRRRGAWLVLPTVAMASMLLASEPEFALFAAATGAVILFAQEGWSRRSIALAVASPIAGAVVAAVQLVPAWMLAPYTERAGAMVEAERWVLGARELAAMVLPIDLGSSALYGTLFLGLSLVALAGVTLGSLRRRPLVPALWMLVGLALWTAAGQRAGLERLWQLTIPTWREFRYPLKTVLVAVLALSLLAGLGVTELANRRRRRRSLQWLGASALLVVALSVAGAGWPTKAVLLSLPVPTLVVAWSAVRGRLAKWTAAATVVASMLAVTFPTLKTTSPAFYAPGAIVDVLRHEDVSLTGASFDRSNLIPGDSETLAAMHAAGAGGGATDFNGLFGLPALSPALPGASSRVRALMSHAKAMSARLDGVFGVRVMILPPQRIDARLATQVVGREPRFDWTAVRLRHYLPRAYAVLHGTRAQTSEEAVARVVSPEFRPGREVVLEGGWDDAWGARPESPAIDQRIDGRTDTTVSIAADLPWDGFVVLNEAWFPGWRATVDGRDAPLLIANAAMRAVPVPAGRHRVELAYEAPGLKAGALLSLVATALMLFVAFALRVRRSV